MSTIDELNKKIEELTLEKRILEMEKEIERLKKEIEGIKGSQIIVSPIYPWYPVEPSPTIPTYPWYDITITSYTLTGPSEGLHL
jgi:hypothetical protein